MEPALWGLPGHLVVRWMPAMPWGKIEGQELSSAATHGSEVPLLIFYPPVKLSSVCTTRVGAFWRGTVSSQG